MGKDYGVIDTALGNSESFSQPSFHVAISKGFYISKTNIDCELFCRFMNSPIGPTHPNKFVCFDADSSTRQFDIRDDTFTVVDSGASAVRTVSWHGAAEFCKWLGKETNIPFRLPTEAEWELAVRGNRNKYDKTTWKSFERKRLSRSEIEKTITPNGLYGFEVGNWTQDFFDFYSHAAKIDPKGPSSPNPYFVNKYGEADHVLRWPNVGAIGRYSRTKPIKNEDTFGFRLCVDESCILDAISSPQNLPKDVCAVVLVQKF